MRRTLDRFARQVLPILLGVLLGIAGVTKLLEQSGPFYILVLAVFEMGLGIAVIVGAWPELTSSLIAITMGVFFVYSVYALFAGHQGPCECGLPSFLSPADALSIVGRNLALLILALISLFYATNSSNRKPLGT